MLGIFQPLFGALVILAIAVAFSNNRSNAAATGAKSSRDQ